MIGIRGGLRDQVQLPIDKDGNISFQFSKSQKKLNTPSSQRLYLNPIKKMHFDMPYLNLELGNDDFMNYLKRKHNLCFFARTHSILLVVMRLINLVMIISHS